MLGFSAKYRSLVVQILLVVTGLVLIAASQTFDCLWLKIQLDRLVAEVGALLVIVAVLHWLFEMNLREEMLREVANVALGSSRLHDIGLENCSIDSRQVDDSDHWSRCAQLTIGFQYSSRFFKDFHRLLNERCQKKLATTAIILQTGSQAAKYLESATAGQPQLDARIAEVVALIGEINGQSKRCTLLFHNRVLRYSFIQTNEWVWITFFTNSPGRTEVPAFKIRAGSPLYVFFAKDIKQLKEEAVEVQ